MRHCAQRDEHVEAVLRLSVNLQLVGRLFSEAVRDILCLTLGKELPA